MTEEEKKEMERLKKIERAYEKICEYERKKWELVKKLIPDFYK